MDNRKKMLGSRIKELRKIKNLTQDKLAEKAGIESTKYLSRIEVGGCYPSLDVLERIADALEEEMKELFNYQHFARNASTPKGVESLLQEASPEKLRLITRLIKDVLK